MGEEGGHPHAVENAFNHIRLSPQVPNHGSRLKLETRGLVVHEFPISRSWDANELRNQIQKHLPDDSFLFEYMKACYETLVTPKLANGVQISGDLLVRLVGQGCIYVRTLLPVTNENDDDEDDLELITSPFARCENMEETLEASISSINEQPCVITDGPPTEKVLGVEVEIVTDGNTNEQPNFSENSIVGLQEFNSPAEVQIIDTAPVGYVFQDEAQMNEPIKCIQVHRASVREDMLDIFSDQRIMFAPPQCYFPSPEALLDHYKIVIPTTSKVISLLKAEPSTPSEMETFNNFKRYLRGLDSTRLGAFLRFYTGSDTLITDRIDITFTQSAGVGRVPVGHTCRFTFELPATYENVCAMREEFNNILSADNWEMNFV
eukprot:gene20842-22885_t